MTIQYKAEDYPNKCDRCKSPSYLGGGRNPLCTNPDCKLFDVEALGGQVVDDDIEKGMAEAALNMAKSIDEGIVDELVNEEADKIENGSPWFAQSPTPFKDVKVPPPIEFDDGVPGGRCLYDAGGYMNAHECQCGQCSGLKEKIQKRGTEKADVGLIPPIKDRIEVGTNVFLECLRRSGPVFSIKEIEGCYLLVEWTELFGTQVSPSWINRDSVELSLQSGEPTWVWVRPHFSTEKVEDIADPVLWNRFSMEELKSTLRQAFQLYLERTGEPLSGLNAYELNYVFEAVNGELSPVSDIDIKKTEGQNVEDRRVEEALCYLDACNSLNSHAEIDHLENLLRGKSKTTKGDGKKTGWDSGHRNGILLDDLEKVEEEISAAAPIPPETRVRSKKTGKLGMVDSPISQQHTGIAVVKWDSGDRFGYLLDALERLDLEKVEEEIVCGAVANTTNDLFIDKTSEEYFKKWSEWSEGVYDESLKPHHGDADKKDWYLDPKKGNTKFPKGVIVCTFKELFLGNVVRGKVSGRLGIVRDAVGDDRVKVEFASGKSSWIYIESLDRVISPVTIDVETLLHQEETPNPEPDVDSHGKKEEEVDIRSFFSV